MCLSRTVGVKMFYLYCVCNNLLCDKHTSDSTLNLSGIAKMSKCVICIVFVIAVILLAHTDKKKKKGERLTKNEQYVKLQIQINKSILFIYTCMYVCMHV